MHPFHINLLSSVLSSVAVCKLVWGSDRQVGAPLRLADLAQWQHAISPVIYVRAEKLLNGFSKSRVCLGGGSTEMPLSGPVSLASRESNGSFGLPAFPSGVRRPVLRPP